MAVRGAFRAMTTGKPGSAHICLPYDLQKQTVRDDELWAQPGHDVYPALRTGADPQDIQRAAARLLSARLVVIVCGGGVVSSGAFDELDRLATLLDAPVCTTVSGKGSLADSHPLHVGVVGANGGTNETRDVLAAADLVFFIGCRAGSTTTEHWKVPTRSATILHLDADPMTIGANYRTDVGMAGDARLSLGMLVKVLADRLPDGGGAASGTVAAGSGRPRAAAIARRARDGKQARLVELGGSIERPIRPERVVLALNKLLPPRSIVVADPGTPCPYFSAYFDAPTPGRHFITNRAHGALGYAMSAGVGAWFARPDATVVSLMGDGSFGFTCGELETIVRRRVPLKMVVFSNAVYGWIKASQKVGYGERYFSVDFDRTNHAKVAEAFGVKAWRVEDPAQVEQAIREALAHDGPALVDVLSQPLQDSAVPVSQWMG
jgi:acetolactate synthase I/II/III large subunit